MSVATEQDTAVDFPRDGSGIEKLLGDPLPYTRQLLTGAYPDLLVADRLATVAAHALHVLPEQSNVFTAASTYLVPKMVAAADRELVTLLGARSYLRSGPYGIFQKNSSGTRVLAFGHANGTACLETIVPQLHRPRPQRPERPRTGARAVVPPRPAARAPGLQCAADQQPRAERSRVRIRPVPWRAAGRAGHRHAVRAVQPELRCLRRRPAERPPSDRTVAAGRRAFRPAGRCPLLPAAATCVAVWHHDPAPPGPGRAPDDTGRLVAALTRLADRLAVPAPELPNGVARVHGELLARREDLRCFDLTAAPLTSQPHHTTHEGTITMPETPAAGSADSIHAWLPEQIAAFLEVDADGIDPEHKLSGLGTDSIPALSLCGEVEDRCGLAAESAPAWGHPTIEVLSRYLAAEPAAG